MTTYYRRPTPVQAVQWTEDNEEEMIRLAGHRFRAVPVQDREEDDEGSGALLESAHDSWVIVRRGQWVVMDPSGAFSLADEDTFTRDHTAQDDTSTEEKRAGLFLFLGGEEEDLPSFADALDGYVSSVLGQKMKDHTPESRSFAFGLTVHHNSVHDFYQAYVDGQDMGVALFTSTPERALGMAGDIVRANIFARNGCVSDRTHLYLSTGCLHGDHEYCASPKGIAGVKTSACCKQCGSPCICSCHLTEEGKAEEKACTCNHPTDDHSVYGCVDGCGCPWMPVRLTSTLMKLREDLDEARRWARHGYEIGQKHCGWSDHGVAPGWLTEGWPRHFGTCDQLKKEVFADHARELAQQLHTDADLRAAEGLYELAQYGHELAKMITPKTDTGAAHQ